MKIKTGWKKFLFRPETEGNDNYCLQAPKEGKQAKQRSGYSGGKEEWRRPKHLSEGWQI